MTDALETEVQYLERLDRQLQEAVRDGATSLPAFLDAVPCAFPVLVKERLRQLGLLDGVVLPHRGAQPLNIVPELHVLDCEWYFTEETSQQLATELSSADSTVCLGAPTVSHALSGLGFDSTLLDSSPYVTQRFSPGPGNTQLRAIDLYSPFELGPMRSFETAFFDAPWYPSDIISWLGAAVRLVRPGGRIGFALFGEYTRPNAWAQRQEILTLCASLGEVALETRRLRYMTPRFEFEVLALSDLEALVDWRVADLVWVCVASTGVLRDAPPPSPTAHTHWRSYIVGPQVVKLRQACGVRDDSFVLRPVGGLSSMVFPSVSRRAADRHPGHPPKFSQLCSHWLAKAQRSSWSGFGALGTT